MKGRKPNLNYFYTFERKCYILNDSEHLGKFDPESDEGVFIGSPENIRAYKIYDMGTIIEFINIKIDNTNNFSSYLQELETQNL